MGELDSRGSAKGRPVSALVGGIAVVFVLAVALSAALAPWVWEALESIAPGRFGFQRILRRVAMLVAIVALVVGLRRAGVRRLADIGLGRGPGRGRAAAMAFAVACVGIALVFAVELGLGNRTATLGDLTAGVAAQAVAGAAVIGVVEEGLGRGALLFPFSPLSPSGFVAANVATSALFSTAHFLRGGTRPAVVDAWSGLRSWIEVVPRIAARFEAWVGLFLTGALLYQLAHRQGHAWGAAGAHAGAVLALQLLGTATSPVEGRDAVFLVFGILPGWGMSVALAATMLALWRFPARTVRAES